MSDYSPPSRVGRRAILRGGAVLAGAAAVGRAATASAVPSTPGRSAAGSGAMADGLADQAVSPYDPAVSQNGWPASSNPNAIGIVTYQVTGSAVSLQVKSGDVATLLMYVADQFDVRVERLTSDCFGYSYRYISGTSTLSNHASGTAIDLNANSHPQGSRNTFSPTEETSIREILAECSDVVRWGGDYTSTPDEMHFEINATPSDPRVAAAAALLQSGTADDGADMKLFTSFKQTGRASVITLDFAGRFVHVGADTYDLLQRKSWISPLETLSADEITLLVAQYPRQTGSLTAAQIIALA